MQKVIDHPPRTIMEVYKMLPEGTRAELIDGILYMSPSPIRNHQWIVLNLAGDINNYVKKHDLGETHIAPFDVYLDEHSNAVQPDIIFVAKENASIIQDHIHGVPDLLIEILSPGNKKYDLEEKKNLYERFGVKEYWIIDPLNKEVIGHDLQDGKYTEFFKSIGKIQSRLLNVSFAF